MPIDLARLPIEDVETAPTCQWDRPKHCHHCRHDDWSKTFWTGLIDRPIVASCVDNRENKAPSLGVTMRREPTTKWLLLTERLALHHAPPGVASNSTLPDISGLHQHSISSMLTPSGAAT